MNTNSLEPETEIGLHRWRFICAHCREGITDARRAVATHHDDGSHLRLYCRNCDLVGIRKAPCWTPFCIFLKDLITSAHQLLQSPRP